MALPTVSETKLNTFLFAEYPSLRNWLEKLDGEKSEQTVESLTAIWAVGAKEAIEIANQLVEVGFFQDRGPRDEPSYWVPFLYRDALHLKQGKAEADGG